MKTVLDESKTWYSNSKNYSEREVHEAIAFWEGEHLLSHEPVPDWWSQYAHRNKLTAKEVLG